MTTKPNYNFIHISAIKTKKAALNKAMEELQAKRVNLGVAPLTAPSDLLPKQKPVTPVTYTPHRCGSAPPATITPPVHAKPNRANHVLVSTERTYAKYELVNDHGNTIIKQTGQDTVTHVTKDGRVTKHTWDMASMRWSSEEVL
jgi:hypothetical protein